MNILVIGAGIFGVTTAIKLSKKHNVTLVDSNDDIMLNASKCNHNRLHFGYHYPRSIETAKQSLEGYESFYNNFKNSITSDFKNYYMIEKNSKVISNEYKSFCKELNLQHIEELPNIDMNFDNIESSFLTNEPIFDYSTIKLTIKNLISQSNIKLLLNTKVKSKKDLDNYDVIINTTYYNINKINRLLNLEESKIRLQNVVVPIFKKNIDKIGLTIMDGNFCSILPKGFDKDTFLLYNVKNSVIQEVDNFDIPLTFNYEYLNKNIYEKFYLNNKIDDVYSESIKYFPFLEDCERIGYWQTIRAVPINNDDCRLTKLTFNEINDKKVISVLSGKITTCWSTAESIDKLL